MSSGTAGRLASGLSGGPWSGEAFPEISCDRAARVEVAIASGENVAQATREIGTTDHIHNWTAIIQISFMAM